MRQALVVGVRPMLFQNRPFPVVPLGPGGWRVNIESGVDTVVTLTVRSSASDEKLVDIASGAVVTISGPCTVSAEITRAGKEESINVVATHLGD